MPDLTETDTAEPTTAEEKPRCRAITTSGHRCKNGATYNGHLCWPHARYRNPVLPDPSHVALPLLEDHASVQLLLSQVAHGLLTHKLEVERARALIHLCQVASSTMPRPPRLPSPQPPAAPSSSRRPLGATGWEADTPTPGSDEEDLVYRLALDDQGIICGDGELPLPSVHWQPPSPEATPWDLIEAAPNQSKPTPRSPSDPDSHHNCAICDEIRKMQGSPYRHPHLQPVVNPFCKHNQPGCQGPASDSRCLFCESVCQSNPDTYNRPRRRTRSQALRPTVPEPQPLPNPLPEQFPDNDPMINPRIAPPASPNPST